MKKSCILIISLLFASHAFAQLHLLNDEFDDASTMSNWQNVNITEGWNATQIEQQDINTTEAGHLFMMPYTTGWYEDRRAPLLYKLVTGDFVFTTQVVMSARGGTGIPSSNYSLAGPMIRTPKTLSNGTTGWTAGQENYIFLSTGYADENHHTCPGACPPPHFEVKNTQNSNSNLRVSEVGSQIITIRMVRIGSVILVLYRTPDNDFIVHQRYNRNDFPAEMQVGFVTYTDWNKVFSYSTNDHNEYTLSPSVNPNINDLSGNPSMPFNPDLEARFDYARFDEVTVPEELENVNLFNEATDEELLDFLGYASNAVLPVSLVEFSAKGQKKQMELSWTTATEMNNKGFEIQKSEDGKSFETIAFQEGKGTTQTPQFYTFSDKDVETNTVYYYRLKQLDLDGTITFSKIEVSILKDENVVINISPQPVQSQATISLIGTRELQAKLIVYNAIGQKVWEQAIEVVARQQDIILETATWQSGMYHVVIESKENRKMIKMIKI